MPEIQCTWGRPFKRSTETCKPATIQRRDCLCAEVIEQRSTAGKLRELNSRNMKGLLQIFDDSRVILEKLIVSQLEEVILAFRGTCRDITVFIRVSHFNP